MPYLFRSVSPHPGPGPEAGRGTAFSSKTGTRQKRFHAVAAASDLQAGRYAKLGANFNSLGAPSATATQIRRDFQTTNAHLGHTDEPALLGANEVGVVY